MAMNLGNILKQIILYLSSVQHHRQDYESVKRYSPEEYVIYEQEQSGERWHGVLLSELSKLAQTTYRGKYVKVDKYNFLVFYYSSKSRKTSLYCRCKVDENGQLVRMQHGYYPGQCRDSADDFVEKANQQFFFN